MKDELKKYTIELLDCQCELVLKCMEYYCYSANYLFQRNRKYTLKDDELKISLITDTYQQISKQYEEAKSKSKNKLFEKIA